MGKVQLCTRTVVLLTTWNRPALLRQSLPQIERETRRIGARLVISDDQSDYEETLTLLEDAKGRDIDVIRRDYIRYRDVQADVYIHHDPQFALAAILKASQGATFLSNVTGRTVLAADEHEQIFRRWEEATSRAHVYTQQNNLFAFRHVVKAHPEAEFILKVDDDIILVEGAFVRMLELWERATQDGHDVLVLSGLLTTPVSVIKQCYGYAVTGAACNAVILYRRSDWEVYVETIPDHVTIADGFDLAFLGRYAPVYRRGAVRISVTPSVAYHTGLNGVHVRNSDLNRDFTGSLDGVVVE